jgi:class 3 adenylate cyclase
MSQSRQLAAIMFTDIVGYKALTGNDDEKNFKIIIRVFIIPFKSYLNIPQR